MLTKSIWLSLKSIPCHRKPWRIITLLVTWLNFDYILRYDIIISYGETKSVVRWTTTDKPNFILLNQRRHWNNVIDSLGTYGMDNILLRYRGGGTEIPHEVFLYLRVVLVQPLRLLILWMDFIIVHALNYNNLINQENTWRTWKKDATFSFLIILSWWHDVMVFNWS